ncbi:MAG: hypothetical protein K8R58_10510, partial [Bacteroidales bacterium]|nr:hypothetical protein [Bacteroidales bacterium]
FSKQLETGHRNSQSALLISTFQVPAAQAFFDLKGFVVKVIRLSNGCREGKPEKLKKTKFLNLSSKSGNRN